MNKLRISPLLTGLLLFSLAAALIAGCSNSPLTEVTAARTSSPSKIETEIPSTPDEDGPPTEDGTAQPQDGEPERVITPGEIDPGLKPLIDIAREDLSERLGIPAEQISVIEGRLVEWPDASLGCPQPDNVYIQVPMDGSIILLQAGGETYQYHTGGDMQVFLCENPADEILGTPKSGDEFIPAPGIDD